MIHFLKSDGPYPQGHQLLIDQLAMIDAVTEQDVAVLDSDDLVDL